jgi:hypothetical protein
MRTDCYRIGEKTLTPIKPADFDARWLRKRCGEASARNTLTVSNASWTKSMRQLSPSVRLERRNDHAASRNFEM